MHIYEIKKNGTDATFLQGRNRDTDIENRLVETVRGEGGQSERAALKHMHYYM